MGGRVKEVISVIALEICVIKAVEYFFNSLNGGVNMNSKPSRQTRAAAFFIFMEAG